MSKSFLTGNFPLSRPRRLRISGAMRELVQDVTLSAHDLIQPFFILEGTDRKEEIKSMRGVYRYSIDLLIGEIQDCYDLGIRSVALFPVTPEPLKTKDGAEALNPDNLICQAIKAIKSSCPNMLIMADVALDPYTDHGHDGLLMANGNMDNDATIAVLTQQAIIQAQAGADIIAPSDMCDGRILSIRKTLEAHKFFDVSIMSYAVKYASALYGPFRDAVGSGASLKGDKKQYQMDFSVKKQAFEEVSMDISEGADMIIIKPGLFYLDIIAQISDKFSHPICAYQVSGEYNMIHHYAGDDLALRRPVIYESLIAFKRAGCQMIISYFAMEFLKN